MLPIQHAFAFFPHVEQLTSAPELLVRLQFNAATSRALMPLEHAALPILAAVIIVLLRPLAHVIAMALAVAS